MAAPGEYRRDRTEGISSIEDLPKAKRTKRSRDVKRHPCPTCGHRAYRDRRMHRLLHDLGDPWSERPVDLYLRYSQHYCSRCKEYFNADMSDLAVSGGSYTYRVVFTAVRLVVEDGLSPRRFLASVARPPGVRAVRHHPELGGGIGEKRRRGMSPRTSSTMARSACCRSSTTGSTSDWSTRFWTTIPATRTSCGSSVGSRRSWTVAV